MSLFPNLQHWMLRSVNWYGHEVRVYLPANLKLTKSQIQQMLRGKTPKFENPLNALEVHHGGQTNHRRPNGFVVVMRNSLHHGNTPLVNASYKAANPDIKFKTPFEILHSCPPITTERLGELRLELRKSVHALKKACWGFIPSETFDMWLKNLDAHQEPPVADNKSGDWESFKSFIWRSIATDCQRRPHGLGVNDYPLPDPKRDAINRYLAQQALTHCKKNGIEPPSTNRDCHDTIRLLRPVVPKLPPKELYRRVLVPLGRISFRQF